MESRIKLNSDIGSNYLLILETDPVIFKVRENVEGVPPQIWAWLWLAQSCYFCQIYTLILPHTHTHTHTHIISLFLRSLVISFELTSHAIVNWNVMPLIRRGSNFAFFAALYCSCLEFNGLLALPTKEGGNKGINPRREQ